jgi:hypothetical protein
VRAFQSVQRCRLTAAVECGLTADCRRRPWVAFFGMTAVALAGNALPAFAATYLVDTSADVPTQNKTTLREAVSQANLSSDNFVEFAPALNGSTITLTQGEIPVNQPMTIVGPGADKLTISGNDASRIFNISTASNTPIAVTLSGLTLSHGHAGNSFLGGAIYTSNVSLNLLDVALEYNNALQGGAIYLHNGAGVASAAKFMRTTVANNSTNPSFGQGGGILAQGGATLQIVDSIINANTSGEAGGGTFYNVGATTIETSRITGNHATGSSGGGLLFFNSPNSVATSNVTIDNSTISDNSSVLNGGGLQLTNVVAVLTGDTISGNSASAAGGGVFVFDSTSPMVTQLTLQQSSVTGNNAITFGGGIDADRALSISVNRSLISGNSVADPAGGGGGIAIGYAKSRSYLNNSTVYNNYAYTNGGGVGIFNGADQTTFNGATIAQNYTFGSTSNGILGAGSTALLNSIVAYNFSHYHNQDLDGSGSIFESYSLIRAIGGASITTITGNRNGEDPLLGVLAVNGGPTLTMMPASSPSKSPALDTGEVNPPPSGTDQRGLPRSANGRRDMGAVERQYPEDVIFRNGFDTLVPG